MVSGNSRIARGFAWRSRARVGAGWLGLALLASMGCDKREGTAARDERSAADRRPAPASTAAGARPRQRPRPRPRPSPLIRIEAQCFQMGAQAGEGTSVERPRHRVCLDAFAVERTKVSHRQYLRCVEAGRCRAPASLKWDDKYRQAAAPVVGVSWSDARSYCKFVGRRLPTEAEWELAACGPREDGRTYPWGSAKPACEFVHYKGCAPKHPIPIGRSSSKGGKEGRPGKDEVPKNQGPTGTVGMAGNVWEWIADRWSADAYAHHAKRNPHGPDQGEHRVIRGGSYYDPPTYLRCTARYHWKPAARLTDVGFRCVK